MCSRTVNRQSRCKRMPRYEAGARQAMSIYGTTLNAGYDDDDASLMRGCWAAAKVQGEGTIVPLSTFCPYGLIRHYGCPKDSGEAGRRPGDIPPGDLFE